MFCHKCGTENRNDRKFCSNCGEPLRDYTKPREDLIMPEDVRDNHAKLVKFNNTITILRSVYWISLVLSVILIIVSFFVPKVAKFPCAMVAVILVVIFFIVYVVKEFLVYKHNKKYKNK